jgi:hypothetical protein
VKIRAVELSPMELAVASLDPDTLKDAVGNKKR